MHQIVLLGWMPGPMEMIIIGGLAVLLFGKRLPEVGKSVGKGLMEFKKGLRGITAEIEDSVNNPTPSKKKSSSSSRYSEIDDRDEATAPKFEPPPVEEGIRE